MKDAFSKAAIDNSMFFGGPLGGTDASKVAPTRPVNDDSFWDDDDSGGGAAAEYVSKKKADELVFIVEYAAD